MNAQNLATVFGVILVIGVPLSAIGVAVPAMRTRLARIWMPVVAIVAVGATAGSLYFSERAGFVPCKLCWFQRIGMYPLALIGTVAAFRRDRHVLPYVVALAALGLLVSAYHTYIQLFPEDSDFCEISNPCTAKWVEAFGWMTIPQMAGSSFVLVIVCSIGALLGREAASSAGAEQSDSTDTTLVP